MEMEPGRHKIKPAGRPVKAIKRDVRACIRFQSGDHSGKDFFENKLLNSRSTEPFCYLSEIAKSCPGRLAEFVAQRNDLPVYDADRKGYSKDFQAFLQRRPLF